MSSPSPDRSSHGPDLVVLEEELASSLASLLDVPRDQIDVAQSFSEAGVESIVGVQWVRSLNARYGLTLPTTALYDAPCVLALAARVRQAIDARHAQASAGPTAAVSPLRSCAQTRQDTAIAIVGMSGRFPRARTLTEFWQNLADGRDCVSEIPAHR